MRVTNLLDKSRYFGIEVRKEMKVKSKEIRPQVISYFKWEQKKKGMIKSKHQFFERERQKVARELSSKGSHPYYVRMKLNLVKRKEEKRLKN